MFLLSKILFRGQVLISKILIKKTKVCIPSFEELHGKTLAHAPNFRLLVQNRMLLLSEKNKIEAKCWISKNAYQKD